MAFLDASAKHFERLWLSAAELRSSAPPDRLLQLTTYRTRIIAYLFALTGVLLMENVLAILAAYCVILGVAAASGIQMAPFIRRNVLIVAVFTLPLAIVGALRFVTPGTPVASVAGFEFSEQGVRSAVLLVIRALTCITITMLLVNSANVHGIFRGLREFGLPESVVATLQLTVNQIHLLGRTAYGMVQGLKARNVVTPTMRQAYTATANQGAALLGKSLASANYLHAAMLARGFEGKFPTDIEPRKAGLVDALVIAGGAAIFVLGIVL